jgi:hypothetical protein
MRKKQGVLGGLSKTASKMSARAGDLVESVAQSPHSIASFNAG